MRICALHPYISCPYPSSALHPHIQLSIPSSNSPSLHPTLHPHIQLFTPKIQLFIPKPNSSSPHPTLHPHISTPTPHLLSNPTSALHPHINSPSPHQLSIPTSSFQHTSTPGRRSPPHQVPWASLGCRIHEHVQLMGKNHSSTFGPYLCFQEHLFVSQPKHILVLFTWAPAMPPCPLFHACCAPKMLLHRFWMSSLFECHHLSAECLGIMYKSGFLAWKRLTHS